MKFLEIVSESSEVLEVFYLMEFSMFDYEKRLQLFEDVGLGNTMQREVDMGEYEEYEDYESEILDIEDEVNDVTINNSFDDDNLHFSSEVDITALELTMDQATYDYIYSILEEDNVRMLIPVSENWDKV